MLRNFFFTPTSTPVEQASFKIELSNNHYARTKKAAALALDALRNAHEQDLLYLSEREQVWLDKLRMDVESLPEDAEPLAKEMIPQCAKLDPAKYDM
ncbi:MAG: methyltransferase MtaB domain-containing protein [Christensenellales bacterium]